MASLEGYVLHVKPAMDSFMTSPSKETLSKLDKEIKNFDWVQMKIFQSQILIPLIFKLDELNDGNLDIRTGVIHCMCHVISKIYLGEKRGLHSIIVVVLKQIRLGNSATMKSDTSEEIKLATTQCLSEALRRSTSDVLEAFYTNESSTLLGQILLTLVEIIDKEKYKKLILSAIECLMVVFYVHDEADAADVVLRNQVADTTFIFLPKTVTTLFKKSISDDIIGESIKLLSLKALGRVLCLMFEETTNEFRKENYDLNAFQKLFGKIDGGALDDDGDDDSFVFEHTYNQEILEDHINILQTTLRSPRWIKASSKKLRPIFVETSKLTAHSSFNIRAAYANMCCLLLQNCANNLKYNFIFMLESILGISEDENTNLARQCQQVLYSLQQRHGTGDLFDENAELLFDAQLTKLPRILNRCDDDEQCTKLLLLKGLLRNLSDEKLNSLLLVPRNMEKFVQCLLTALDLCLFRDLLNEDNALCLVQNADDFEECAKLPWRKFKHFSTERPVAILYDICTLLGKAPSINRNIFDYCLELLEQQHPAMNELILLLTIMATGQQRQQGYINSDLVNLLLIELLKEKHWHLALRPDEVSRLEHNKPTSWFADRIPGLYEAFEVRMQDCDSDDENDVEVARQNCVSILDAQFNVLHTCLVLDSLAHCATYKGESFDQYIFRSLHRVLLKLANCNTCIYQAAKFAFISILKALKYAEASHLIEGSTDYITYHLNSLLKRSPESSGAVDILTVVLQLSSRSNTPHLESIFQTIREECSKSYQTNNINSYLKVFNAFLLHVTKWQEQSNEMLDNVPMQIEFDTSEVDILNGWLNAKAPEFIVAQDNCDDLNNPNTRVEDQQHCDNNRTDNNMPEHRAEKQTLPKYIEVIKEILSQVVKFISNGNQTHQILALECLIVGLPLLQDYEDELLPLVHLIWDPFVQKFCQKDPLVVNRCISLLHVMGIHAKEFILKRSLNNVIPHIKAFLNEAAKKSSSECFKVKTQEFKMQIKLLEQLSSLIKNLQIGGRNLHDIALTVSLYLSQKQPYELQTCAVRFFNSLHTYNGPFVYLIVLKYLQQKDFKTNVYKILKDVNK